MPGTLTFELTANEPAGALAAPDTGADLTNRPFGLHMETCYILDCAVELGEITPLEDMVYRVQTPAAMQLVALSDRDASMPPHWLRNTARQYLDSLPLMDRYVWALRSVHSFEFALNMFSERLAFVVQTKVQSDLGIDEKTSIRFMDEAGPAMFSTKVFPTVHDVTQERVSAFIASEYRETYERLERDLQITQEALSWLALPGNRERAREIAQRLFPEMPEVLPATALQNVLAPKTARKLEGLRLKAQRQARSAIKKAVKLFHKTGLEDSVRMMVSGQEVEISHPTSPFKFVLQPLKKGWLEQRTLQPGGHTPYQLTLLTKEGVFLSRLCVLFDKTPVLDQLLGLTLFVESGCENELLSKANWFGYENVEEVRSILAANAPSLLDKVPLPRAFRTSQGMSTKDMFGMLDKHHQIDMQWAPYRGPVRNWIATWMGGLYASLPATDAGTLALA